VDSAEWLLVFENEGAPSRRGPPSAGSPGGAAWGSHGEPAWGLCHNYSTKAYTLFFSSLPLSLSLFIHLLFPPCKVFLLYLQNKVSARGGGGGLLESLLVTTRPRNNLSHCIAMSFYLTYSSNRKPASYHEVGHAVRELKTLSQA
jgi:hypothetical protein